MMKTNTETGQYSAVLLDNGSHSRRSLFLCWLAVLLLAPDPTAMGATVQVDVGGGGTINFSPEIVNIAVGDTVQWNWSSTTVGHSVTSGSYPTLSGLFDAGIHTAPFTFSYTFTTAGTFDYFCKPHGEMGMTGQVKVIQATKPPSQLLNISTRLRIKGEDTLLIGGMIATGTVDKKVIILAIGPTLTGFGLAGAMQDPTLELFRGNVSVASNDDWKKSPQQAEIASSGVAPGKDAESAIIASLNANQNYTAIVRGKNGETGLAAVQVFDLDQAASSKLANISTRGFVDVDDNVMIAGVIVGPSNGNTTKILVRSLGPTLGDFNVQGFLVDPTLDLVNASGTVIRSNDNWKLTQRTEIENAGLAPSHDEEAALIETLPPASYTAIVRGKARTTGVALVEAYNIP